MKFFKKQILFSYQGDDASFCIKNFLENNNIHYDWLDELWPHRQFLAHNVVVDLTKSFADMQIICC